MCVNFLLMYVKMAEERWKCFSAFFIGALKPVKNVGVQNLIHIHRRIKWVQKFIAIHVNFISDIVDLLIFRLFWASCNNCVCQLTLRHVTVEVGSMRLHPRRMFTKGTLRSQTIGGLSEIEVNLYRSRRLHSGVFVSTLWVSQKPKDVIDCSVFQYVCLFWHSIRIWSPFSLPVNPWIFHSQTAPECVKTAGNQ